MLRSVLVGLDGSAFGESAFRLGARWALRDKALLVGLGIVDEPRIRAAQAVPLGALPFKEHRDEMVALHARRRVEQFLGQFSVRCAEMGVSAKVLEDVGNPSDQILMEAQRYDIILLGKQSYFRIDTQEGPCETVFEIVKSSPRPVVVVPQELPDGDCIALAYDGSLQSARAAFALVASGVGAAKPVHVISVDSDHLAAARCANRAVEFLQSHDVETTAHPIASQALAADVLLEQTAKLGADLLVMGAYGKSTLYDFVFGSVTRTILREMRVPLFLFH